MGPGSSTAGANLNGPSNISGTGGGPGNNLGAGGGRARNRQGARAGENPTIAHLTQRSQGPCPEWRGLYQDDIQASLEKLNNIGKAFSPLSLTLRKLPVPLFAMEERGLVDKIAKLIEESTLLRSVVYSMDVEVVARNPGASETETT